MIFRDGSGRIRSLKSPCFQLIEIVETARRETETIFQAAERLLTHEALWESNGIQSEAAERLGISQRMMTYNIKKHRSHIENHAPRRKARAHDQQGGSHV